MRGVRREDAVPERKVWRGERHCKMLVSTAGPLPPPPIRTPHPPLPDCFHPNQSRVERYRCRSVEAPHGIGIELAQYRSIGLWLDGSFLTLYLVTAANSSIRFSLQRLKFLFFYINCSFFSLYKLDWHREY